MYYYFASTLPMLMPDHPPPFSVADFRERCVDHLTAGDMAAMNGMLDQQPPQEPHPFVRDWQCADGQLRNVLVRTRAERMHKEPTAYLREIGGSDTTLENAVSEAYSRPNPLEREKALDQIRWECIEELAGLDPFTGRAILAYGLQLSILERWARMDKEAGSAAVETLLQRDAAEEEHK
ncbi:MAG: DUF2764 family protein [Lentisphaerae bacterium]|nr:DUF2764 family protein [Lentisphaerota bacterium]